MKNFFIVLTAAVIISLSANCQGLKVPETVKNAFAAKFPNATNVTWGKENAKEYEAEFKWNNSSVSANFGMGGSWVETETTIPASELPAAVTDFVHSKYPGAAYSRVEKIEKPGGKILYEVNIKVSGKKKELELNADGSLAE